MNRLAIIPYFGGNSRASHSVQDNRLSDLKQCFESIVCEAHIKIFVANKEDLDTVNDLRIEAEVILLKGIDPIFLPAEACKLQQSLNSIEMWDYILVTEADQEYFADWEKIDSKLDDTTYVSPHRLEQLPEGMVSNRPTVIKDDVAYSCPNSSVQKDDVHEWYTPSDKIQAFGGGFYCTISKFNSIKFSNSSDLPIEHTTGFNAFSSGGCLKTTDITGYFYVVHLSGYEYNLKKIK